MVYTVLVCTVWYIQYWYVRYGMYCMVFVIAAFFGGNFNHTDSSRSSSLGINCDF